MKAIATLLIFAAYVYCLSDELRHRKSKRFIAILTVAYAAMIVVVIL